MKTELTFKESQELIHLNENIYIEDKASLSTNDHNIQSAPIFILSDLFELLPKVIKVYDEYRGKEVEYQLTMNCIGSKWFVDYNEHQLSDSYNSIITCYDEELINALFELAKWCIKNNKI